jgi:hypothetical protein
VGVVLQSPAVEDYNRDQGEENEKSVPKKGI